MLAQKLKVVALSLLLLAVVAAGAGWLTHPLAMGDEPRMKYTPPARQPATATTPNDANPTRMTIIGRVLDPQGQPIAGARVAVLADRKRQAGDIDSRHRGILMGTAAVDSGGRFTLDITTIPAARLTHLGLIAAAPARGMSAIDLKPDAERQETSIVLSPEMPVEGRLVDVQGQPAAGVVVRVATLKFQHEFRPYDAKAGPVLWPSPDDRRRRPIPDARPERRRAGNLRGRGSPVRAPGVLDPDRVPERGHAPARVDDHAASGQGGRGARRTFRRRQAGGRCGLRRVSPKPLGVGGGLAFPDRWPGPVRGSSPGRQASASKAFRPGPRSTRFASIRPRTSRTFTPAS